MHCSRPQIMRSLWLKRQGIKSRRQAPGFSGQKGSRIRRRAKVRHRIGLNVPMFLQMNFALDSNDAVLTTIQLTSRHI